VAIEGEQAVGDTGIATPSRLKKSDTPYRKWMQKLAHYFALIASYVFAAASGRPIYQAIL
jgi:hypothetical protein